MDLKGKNVLVVGLGKSGMAAFDLLKLMQANVWLYDGNEKFSLDNISAPLYLGSFPKDKFQELDLAVFSPGVPLDIELAQFLKDNNIKIIGEIELAYMVEKGTVIGITGTNGKTTTTTLVGEIMKKYNPNTLVVGNIGYPYTKEVIKTSNDSITVAEISSFQLETAVKFRPRVSAILNITPDHLNRHKTMECYTQMKFDIAKNQKDDDLCVLNYDDELIRKNEKQIKCNIEYFSSKQKISNGLYQNDKKEIVDGKTNQVLMSMKDTKLVGDHNCENIMAAILMSRKMGLPMDLIIDTIKKFSPVEHRVEFVENIDGVDYYNDSKGTNPDAAIKAIKSMDKPTILIGGGYNKGGDFDEWIKAFDGKVKKLLLLGETKEKIAADAKKCGFENYEFVKDLKEAVEKAHEYAQSGDAVLLSPACASWDMFKSYEQRGDLFKEYVRNYM